MIAGDKELPPGASRDEAVSFFNADYAKRGWRVVDARLDPSGPRTIGGHAWRVFFMTERSLWQEGRESV
jgi:hypothetical protein